MRPITEHTDQWLDWSGMKSKCQNCHTVSLQGSTGLTIDPQLTQSGMNLPFLGEWTIVFFGFPICIPQDTEQTKHNLHHLLDRFV